MYTHYYGSLYCLRCQADLTLPDSVEFETTHNERFTGYYRTRLEPVVVDNNQRAYGKLVDVSGMIAAGFHSGSACCSCGNEMDTDEVDIRECEIFVPILCPECSTSESVVYVEDISSYREVIGVRDKDDMVVVDGLYKTEGFDEGGTNQRFMCRACMHEWECPDDEDIDFV